MTALILFYIGNIGIGWGHILFLVVLLLVIASVVIVLLYSSRKKKKGAIATKEIAIDFTKFNFRRDLGFDPYANIAAAKTVDRQSDDYNEETNYFIAIFCEIEALSKDNEILRDQIDKIHVAISFNDKIIAYLKNAVDVFSMLKEKTQKNILVLETAGLKTLEEQTGHTEQQKILKELSLIEKKYLDRQKISDAYKAQLEKASDFMRTKIIENDTNKFDLKEKLDNQSRYSGVDKKVKENIYIQYKLLTKYDTLQNNLLNVNNTFYLIKHSDGRLRRFVPTYNNICQESGINKKIARSLYRKPRDYREKLDEYSLKIIETGTCIKQIYSDIKSDALSYRLRKKSSDQFLNAEKFTSEEIISAEDKICKTIGLVADRLSLIEMQVEAYENYCTTLRKYKALTVSKSAKHIGKDEYRARLKSAESDFNLATKELEEINEKLNTKVNAKTVQYGKGIITTEYISAIENNGGGGKYDGYIDAAVVISTDFAQDGTMNYIGDPEAFFKKWMDDAKREKEERQHKEEVKRQSLERNYPLDEDEVAKRLEQLEKLLTSDTERKKNKLGEEKEQRRSDKIAKRADEIMVLRTGLKYIDTKKEADAFKSKLKALYKTFDDDEKESAVIDDLYRKSLFQAEYLGKK